MDKIVHMLPLVEPKKSHQKKPWFSRNWKKSLALASLIFAIAEGAALAQQGYNHSQGLTIEPGPTKVAIDTIWVLLTACLVFFMNAGFAMLETGFCRYKNAVNILSKNLIVFAIASLVFWSIGFALMFGDGNNWIGWNGWFLRGNDNSPSTGNFYQGVFHSLNWASIPLQAKFFFQLVFAGTAATIVSGAVAERIKFKSFIIFSSFLVGISYPITGHWIWGGGWLQKLNFYDFAGSTVVHSVGGWAALVGASLLGPRTGKYFNNQSRAIPGHNFSLSTLGCFILWLGWFGFNPGSTMEVDVNAICHIVLTTNTAAAAGGLSATFTSWKRFRFPDLSMTINGILAGLVAITASCRYVSVGWAFVIGAIAGIIVVYGVDLFDQWKIDDPVGAIPVHLVCGIWGTLAVGLFSEGIGQLYSQGPARGLLVNGGVAGLQQFLVQLLGVLVVGLFTTGFSWFIWSAMKGTFGLRVTQEAERKGLDLNQHGFPAYSGFKFEDESFDDDKFN